MRGPSRQPHDGSMPGEPIAGTEPEMTAADAARGAQQWKTTRSTQGTDKNRTIALVRRLAIGGALAAALAFTKHRRPGRRPGQHVRPQPGRRGRAELGGPLRPLRTRGLHGSGTAPAYKVGIPERKQRQAWPRSEADPSADARAARTSPSSRSASGGTRTPSPVAGPRMATVPKQSPFSRVSDITSKHTMVPCSSNTPTAQPRPPRFGGSGREESQ